MCGTCGCSKTAKGTVTDLQSGQVLLRDGHARPHGGEHHHHHGHDHSHDHDHHHHDRAHDHAQDHANHALEAAIMGKNDQLARENREWLSEQNIIALNLVSSPGSGKTTLLERTIRELYDSVPICVIEGDQETVNDAERIRATGCRVVQINTGTGCHLEADMIAKGLRQLDPPRNSLAMIENVGNLVCPAMFDLGERARVAILSVTEGEDKPLKYPHMFRSSQVMLLNKVDLLPYLNFDVARSIAAAREVNPDIHVIEVSATTGAGMADWYAWIRQQLQIGQEAAAELHG
ncbi:MAG: hydrogenase nickel incorporation protein HypB [Pseudomonadota bacterium]